MGGIGDGTDGQDDFNQSVLPFNALRHYAHFTQRFRISTKISDDGGPRCSFCVAIVGTAHCPRFPKGTPADVLGGHCCISTPRKRDSETYEISGLDIGRERAMFQKIEMICLSTLWLASRMRGAASPPLSPRTPGFPKEK